MFPGVGGSAASSRVRRWVALGLWVALILVASGDMFSFQSSEGILRRLDPEPRPRSQLVLLRMLLHLVEYGLLGLLAHRAFRAPGRGRVTALAFALGLCVAVAASDEGLQTFQPHRTGSSRDVILNLLGSSLGVLVSLLGRFAEPPTPRVDA